MCSIRYSTKDKLEAYSQYLSLAFKPPIVRTHLNETSNNSVFSYDLYDYCMYRLATQRMNLETIFELSSLTTDLNIPLQALSYNDYNNIFLFKKNPTLYTYLYTQLSTKFSEIKKYTYTAKINTL